MSSMGRVRGTLHRHHEYCGVNEGKISDIMTSIGQVREHFINIMYSMGQVSRIFHRFYE